MKNFTLKKEAADSNETLVPIYETVVNTAKPQTEYLPVLVKTL